MKNYKGPFRFIRRTEDEIISEPPKVLRGNRGNFLIRDIVRHRHPRLMEDEKTEGDLMEWLATSHGKVVHHPHPLYANSNSKTLYLHNDIKFYLMQCLQILVQADLIVLQNL